MANMIILHLTCTDKANYGDVLAYAWHTRAVNEQKNLSLTLGSEFDISPDYNMYVTNK